jgi:hypothetical protein
VLVKSSTKDLPRPIFEIAIRDSQPLRSVQLIRYRPKLSIHALSEWVRDGRIQYREDIVDGLENAPAALAGLYEGRNMGRQLIRVRPDPYL